MFPHDHDGSEKRREERTVVDHVLFAFVCLFVCLFVVIVVVAAVAAAVNNWLVCRGCWRKLVVIMC